MLGDGVAYQPVPGNADPYDQIHQLVANVLGELDAAAGPDAPLSIIAHSLGAVIASNFVWDAQHGTLPTPTASPLGRCETLTNFYTMGSPLAIWGLRYPDFGDPIAVPSSTQTALPGEWISANAAASSGPKRSSQRCAIQGGSDSAWIRCSSGSRSSEGTGMPT